MTGDEHGERRRIVEAVDRIVVAFAPDPAEPVDESQDLVNDLGYHSLALVRLMVALEDCFAMTDEGDELPPLGFVRGLHEYMVRKVAAGQARIPAAVGVEEYLEEQVTGGAA